METNKRNKINIEIDMLGNFKNTYPLTIFNATEGPPSVITVIIGYPEELNQDPKLFKASFPSTET